MGKHTKEERKQYRTNKLTQCLATLSPDRAESNTVTLWLSNIYNHIPPSWLFEAFAIQCTNLNLSYIYRYYSFF